MKRMLTVFVIAMAVLFMAIAIRAPETYAESGFYTSQNCSLCHGSSSTCAGCHAHGTHPDNNKDSINLTAATDKTVYQPGEAMSVTIDGGYRSGWVRAILYDENGAEIGRSTGPSGRGGGDSFPITFSGTNITAPSTTGTYTYSASWYGNQYDKSGAAFGNWRPDPNNPNHGEEIVATNTFTVEAQGQGDITVTDSVAPVADLSVDFGSIREGTSAEQTVTIKNDGNADLSIGSIASANPLSAPFSIAANGCEGAVLAPASSCTVTVQFSPALEGVYNDSFDIPSDDPDENPVTMSLSGTATALPVADITMTDSVAPVADLSVDFGSIREGTSAEQTVTIKNDGNADLSIGSIASANPLSAPFSIAANGCEGAVLAPASSCTVTVQFSPALEGVYNDSFDIPSDDLDENPVTMSLSGTATALPVADITVTDSVAPDNDLAIDFGELRGGRQMEQTVTISNDGDGELLVGNVGEQNPLAGPFSIVGDICSGATLAGSDDCTLTVVFSPQKWCPQGSEEEEYDTLSSDGSSGCAYNDSFDIPSSDPDENPVTVSVNGTGMPVNSNNPPGMFKLLRPANGEVDLDTDLEFRWEKTTDPDGEHVSYSLYISEDQSFAGSTTYDVAALAVKGTFAASAGLGLALFGIAFAGDVRKRRRILLAAAFIIAVAILMAACSGGDSVTLSPNPEVSQPVSGLNGETTYYWKVVAQDGVGGVTESEVWTFTTK